MADEIKQENQEGENNGQESGNNEKLFKQADVDRILQERLNREKQTHKTDKDSWESEKTTYKTSLEKYEEKLKALIAPTILNDVPEEFRELIEKLPLLEQVEWISKHASGDGKQSNKKFIPRTNGENKDEDFKNNTQPKIDFVV